MRHTALMLLLLYVFSVQSAENIIRGAVYFVIHTLQNSTMYRAGSKTIFCAPDFYRIRIPYTKIVSACQPLLKDSDAIITFHDQETDTLDLKRDNNALATLVIWRAMLDPAAKIYVYKACMDLTLKTVQLYDKRGHLITGVNGISCCEDSSLEDYRKMIRDCADFADPSLLNVRSSIWHGERIGKIDKITLTHQKIKSWDGDTPCYHHVPRCSDSSATLYFSTADDQDEDCVILMSDLAFQ
jgi:hypothetical protein